MKEVKGYSLYMHAYGTNEKRTNKKAI